MSVFTEGHVHLDTPATILAVLAELVGGDAEKFRGTVSSWPEGNPPGPARWAIEVNDHNGNRTTAELGDHLVLTYGRLLRLSESEYVDAQSGS